MKKLSKDDVEHVQERIDLAFDVIEDLVNQPEKVESLPNNAVIIPMPAKTSKHSM